MIVSNFLKRAISGLLFVVVLTGCIFIHPICFYILFFIINILGLIEFSRMAKHMNIHVNLFFCILCGSVLFTVGFLHNYINYKDGYLYFFLLTFIMSICELYRKRGNGFQNIAFSYYALLYISLPFTLLIYLPYMTSGKWMPEIIFFPFLLVWVNDTFAYLSGSLLGKHKLFPRISPKKSWEGFFGGLILVLASSQAFAWFAPEISRLNWLGLATTVVLFGTWGDLIESLLKRTLGVKDSGHILPGHGGMLDRFDSVMLAVPASYIYIELFIRN